LDQLNLILHTENTNLEKNNRWWVLLAVGIGTFMSALDGSVVNTMLPLIKEAFTAQIHSVEWVVTIYLLVLSGLLLSFGRLGDLHGHKNVYLSGFFIFIISSVLCSISASITQLVIFRGIQALGAAMLSANSPAILTKSFPSQQRGRALGLQATMTYLGLTIGPPLGGWLSIAFSWRSVFFINLPVGAIAFLLSLRYIQQDKNRQDKKENFDIFGAILFTGGLVVLLLGLNQGHAWGWVSPMIITFLLSATFLMVAFLFVERRSKYPMLDISLFGNRLFSVTVISAIFNYICVYSLIFLMPFYLIEGRSFDAAFTGRILMAQPIVMMFVAPISGTLSDRFGARGLSTAGMAILSVGIFLLSRLSADSSLPQIIFSLCVAGLGTGIFISPNNSALMGSAPRHRQGIAAGILATARNMGMVLGVGLSGAVFSTFYSSDLINQTIFVASNNSLLVVTFVGIAGVLVSLIPTSHLEANTGQSDDVNDYFERQR
jgi:EmrB/QacA subfamily drug resistance transporter